MDRRSLILLLVTALTVVAIGLSAATLTSTVDPSKSGDSPETADTTSGDSPGEASNDRTGPDSAVTVQRLLVLFGVLAVLGYLAVNHERGGVFVAALVAFVLVAYLALVAVGDTSLTPEESSGSGTAERAEAGGESGDSDGGVDLTLPTAGLLGALAVVALSVLVVAARLRGADGSQSRTDPVEETEPLGAIAGQAADRIEAAPADEGKRGTDAGNEVYRAWQEMTAQLDIEHTETTTPREFQRRAVAAGMAPDDVRELTALFETVRYGGETATESREQRAVSVLRRIESAYGGRG